jgi:hypothetical protein
MRTPYAGDVAGEIGMNVRACHRVSYPPVDAWRLVLSSLLLAAAMVGDAWLGRVGLPPALGAGLELVGLAASAALLAPVARVRWLPWATAGLMGAAVVALALLVEPSRPSGSIFIAMMLAAISPSAGVGLVATGLLVASEVIAALI